MKTVTAAIRSLLATFLVFSLLLGACGPAPPTDTPEPTVTMLTISTPTELPSATPAPTKTPTALPQPTATPTTTPTPGPTSVPLTDIDLVFAPFVEPEIEAARPVHHEPIAPDLSNVRVPFALSETQRERLARDGFVVIPGGYREFSFLYEDAISLNLPVIVTSDSLLHNYHLLFDKVLRTAEVPYLTPLLRDLNRALLTRTTEEYEALKNTSWEDAARRTVAFAGVASKLLDPEVQVPGYAADLVEAELTLIEKALGVQPSPLFPGLTEGEDYS